MNWLIETFSAFFSTEDQEQAELRTQLMLEQHRQEYIQQLDIETHYDIPIGEQTVFYFVADKNLWLHTAGNFTQRTRLFADIPHELLCKEFFLSAFQQCEISSNRGKFSIKHHYDPKTVTRHEDVATKKVTFTCPTHILVAVYINGANFHQFRDECLDLKKERKKRHIVSKDGDFTARLCENNSFELTFTRPINKQRDVWVEIPIVLAENDSFESSAATMSLEIPSRIEIGLKLLARAREIGDAKLIEKINM